MDVRQLRYFLVTAQLEHVTHAARKLSIAQPALSQSLHRLEAELGVKLFAREGRNLRLTEEGAYLKDRLSPIISELDSACAGLEAFAIAGANTVNLCIATASVIAVDAIGTFAPQHAETRFDVSRDDASPRNDIVVDTIRNVDGKSGVTHVTNSRADFAERVCIAIPASRPHEEIDHARRARGRALHQSRGLEALSLHLRRAMRDQGIRARRHVRERQPRRGAKDDKPGSRRRLLARAQLGSRQRRRCHRPAPGRRWLLENDSPRAHVPGPREGGGARVLRASRRALRRRVGE